MPVLGLLLHVTVEHVQVRQAFREQGDKALMIRIGPVRFLFELT